MTGDVTWPQLLFLVGVIVAVATGVGTLSWLVIWKVWGLISEERDITEKRFTLVQERINLEKEMLDARLTKIEIFNAGLMSVMKQMEEFRSDVRGQFDDLRNVRRDDMRNIHRRLDRIVELERKVDPD